MILDKKEYHRQYYLRNKAKRWAEEFKLSPEEEREIYSPVYIEPPSKQKPRRKWAEIPKDLEPVNTKKRIRDLTPDERRAYYRRYYHLNKDSCQRYYKDWLKRNKDYNVIANKDWRRLNPEKYWASDRFKTARRTLRRHFKDDTLRFRDFPGFC